MSEQLLYIVRSLCTSLKPIKPCLHENRIYDPSLFLESTCYLIITTFTLHELRQRSCTSQDWKSFKIPSERFAILKTNNSRCGASSEINNPCIPNVVNDDIARMYISPADPCSVQLNRDILDLRKSFLLVS
jgi:hypothetical protein